MGDEAIDQSDGGRDPEKGEEDPSAGAGWRESVLRIGAALLCLVAFLLAVRLIGVATDQLASLLQERVQRVVADDLSALGGGWLSTYVLTNGSVVAALSVALFASGVFGGPQLLLTVAGTRLGGAGFVVLIGGLDWLRRRKSIRSALGLGLLTFVVTHTIYLPATAAAYLTRDLFLALPDYLPVLSELDLDVFRRLRALSVELVEALGNAPALVGGFLLLFGSIYAFDQVLKGVNEERLRKSLPLGRPWLLFLGGLVVTAVTASISFSVGALVPLYSRGYVNTREMTPYILGANLATLVDTALAGVVLGSPGAVAIVLGLSLVVAVFTLLAMIFFRRYFSLVDAVMTRITASRSSFAVCFAVLLLVPVVLTLGSLL